MEFNYLKVKSLVVLCFYSFCGYNHAQVISAGYGHSLKICNDGSVQAVGRNSFGELGNGSFTNTSTPVSVGSLNPRIVQVKGGAAHSLVLKCDSTVWGWGFNSSGELGTGNNTSSNIPIQVHGQGNIGFLTGIKALEAGGAHSIALKNDGTVLEWGDGNMLPMAVNSLSDIIDIDCGGSHSLALKNDGTVWAWGSNNSGQLGNGSNTNSINPVQVNFLTGIIAVVCGTNHSLALKSDGSVWAWGNNFFGQLGIGNNSNNNVPMQVLSLTNVVDITAGQSHSVALRNDGTVWTWGFSYYGNLGNGTNIDTQSPVQVHGLGNIGFLTDITSVESGEEHSFALKSDGTIYTWGQNIYGQLGNGNTSNSNIPVVMGGCIPFIPNTIQNLNICQGQTVIVGSNIYSTNGTYIDTLTSLYNCGRDSIVITNLTVMPLSGFTQNLSICNGQSVTIGSSTYTVDGTFVDTLTAANSCDSIVTTNLTIKPNYSITKNLSICNGQSVTIGSSTYTVDGTFVDTLTAANGCDSIITTNLTVKPNYSITQNLSICNGQSVTIGSNTYTADGTFVDTLTTANGCDSIVTTNLTIKPNYSITQNLSICNGQSVTIGSSTYTVDGTFVDTLTAANSCDSIVTTNLTIKPNYSITQNLSICNGQSVTIGSSTYTVDGTFVDTLTAANGCDSIVTTNLTIKPNYSITQNLSICNGQSVTIGSSTYTVDGTFVDTLTAANGCDSIVTTNLTIKSNYSITQNLSICNGESITIGSNTYSTDGTYLDTLTAANGCDSLVSTVLNIKLGSLLTQNFFICEGQIVTVGSKIYNVSGTYIDTLTAANGCDSIVTTNLSCFSKLISGGEMHSVASCGNGLQAAGDNNNGQLGNGNTNDSNNPVPVNFLTGLKSIASGHLHSLALKNDGTVWSWGRNNFGQLGNGSNTDSNVPVQVISIPSNIVAVACGGMFSLALQSDGSLWVWGSNSSGQLGDGTNIDRNTAFKLASISGITHAAGGSSHTLAVKNDGSVWVWGNNTNGQLGTGNTVSSNVPLQLPTLTQNFIGVAGGGNHSLALQNNGTVWAWGLNNNGQLGIGNNTGSNIPVQISSATLSGITILAGGFSHSMATKSDSTVWVWGANSYGQLGMGDNLSRNLPVQLTALSKIKSIACGSGHSLAERDDGLVWVWGDNFDGKLGIGSNTNSTLPAVMNNCDIVTRIKSINAAETLFIYPNPTSGKITIENVIYRALQKDIRIDIYNTIGERIFPQITFHDQNTELDLSGYAKGIYFINYYTKEIKYSGKVMVR